MLRTHIRCRRMRVDEYDLIIPEVSPDRFHLLVYVAVAGKCFAAFGMPRQRSHKVRVFDLLIQIPDKSTARHMGRRNLVERFCSGCLFNGFKIVTLRFSPAARNILLIA